MAKDIEGAYYYTLDIFKWSHDCYLSDPSVYVIGYPSERRVLVPFLKDYIREVGLKSIYIPFCREENKIIVGDNKGIY